MPIGRAGFQEVGLSLSFSVEEASPEAEAIVALAGKELERAFQVLWLSLDTPETRPSAA